MSQTLHPNQTPRAGDIVHPLCARCRAPMWLTRVKDEYPGYERRTFECQACGATMTEWACMSREKKGAPDGGDDAGVE